MSLQGGNDIFFPDQPLENPEKDKLGYKPLAERIAKSILNGTFPDSFTIAIQGPWGSGKSTTLNFIRHYLEKQDQNVRPIIVQFNPWWFSRSGEEILLNFFKQLSAAIGKGKSRRGKIIARKLLRIGFLLSPYIPIPYSDMIGKILDIFARYALQIPNDIFKLRNGIIEELKKLKRKVVVFVDDIDRLHPEEMKQLFMVIRTITDFPNTIYLLAFDRKVVASSIGDDNKISGEDYLQKIVQMPVDLPPIEGEFLSKELSTKIMEILNKQASKNKDSLMDEKALDFVISLLTQGYPLGDKDPVRTLRDVYRLLNRLSFTYPVVEGNVVPSDFVAIEALSIFYPKIYEAIKNHSERFVSYNQIDDEEDKKFYDALLENETETARQLLEFLFPRVGGSNYIEIGRKDSPEYKRSRICGEAFPSYFCLTSTNWMPNEEIEEILSTKEADRIKDKLLKKGAYKINFFLDRLRSLVLEIPSEELWPLVECLVKFGDDLITEIKEAKLVYAGLPAENLAYFTLQEVVVNSLKRLRKDRQEYYPNKVASFFETSESFSTTVGVVAAIEETKDYREVFSKESSKEFEIFKARVLNKLSEGSTKILDTPQLQMVLRYWYRWDKESFDAWCKEIMKNLEKYDRTKVLRLRKAFNAIIKDDEIKDEEKSVFETYAKKLESAMRRLGILDTQRPENGEKNHEA